MFRSRRHFSASGLTRTTTIEDPGFGRGPTTGLFGTGSLSMVIIITIHLLLLLVLFLALVLVLCLLPFLLSPSS